MVQIVWIGAGRLRLFFLVRVGGTDMSNTRGALYSKPRQEIYVKTGTLGVPGGTNNENFLYPKQNKTETLSTLRRLLLELAIVRREARSVILVNDRENCKQSDFDRKG